MVGAIDSGAECQVATSPQGLLDGGKLFAAAEVSLQVSRVDAGLDPGVDEGAALTRQRAAGGCLLVSSWAGECVWVSGPVTCWLVSGMVREGRRWCTGRAPLEAGRAIVSVSSGAPSSSQAGFTTPVSSAASETSWSRVGDIVCL